jgi:uncharacterized protein with HEPN domain
MEWPSLPTINVGIPELIFFRCGPLAVELGIEIISEASRQVPDELKLQYRHIYWQEIAGIGNLIRHEYGRIDDRIMWRVVQKYLPELKVVVLDMLNLQGPPKSRR